MSKLTKFVATAAGAAALLGAPAAQAALIGLYQFNDAAQLGRDTSGNGTNASVVASVGYNAAGHQGGAASFSSSGYLSVPIDVSPNALPQMTWGAWVKASTASTIQTVLSPDNCCYDRELDIDHRGGGGNTWSAFTGNGVLSSGVAVTASQWTFMAAVYDQASSSMTFYVDGQSITTSGTNFSSSFNFFHIGHNPGYNQPFSGLIDDVFVYDQALTAGQIASIRANGVTAVPEPGSLALAGLGGMLALGVSSRRRTGKREPG